MAGLENLKRRVEMADVLGLVAFLAVCGAGWYYLVRKGGK